VVQSPYRLWQAEYIRKEKIPMFDVYFKYVDGNEILCKDITKIELLGTSGYTPISGDQLLTYQFRIHDAMHLYSDSSNFSVTCNGLLYLEVRKR
jgi:hypothetical protein